MPKRNYFPVTIQSSRLWTLHKA